MAKYNVGDVLEITERFELEGAVYLEGEQYTVSKESNLSYGLRGDRRKYRNAISEVDAHSGFRKVEPKPLPDVHMVFGGKYWNPEVGEYYTVTSIDFEKERVYFEFFNGSHAERSFGIIPEHFDGVLPPVKPTTQEVDGEAIAEETQKALDELKEKLKPENTLASAEARIGDSWESSVSIPEPETIAVDSLREALDFLGIQEVFDTENIISLAKRLS